MSDVLVVKFKVRRPIPYYVPKKWRSYTYAKIFIDNELKGEWYVMQYGGFNEFLKIAKKKYGFENFRIQHWNSENRDY